MPIYETEIKPLITAINAIVNVINVASISRKVPAKFLSMQLKHVNSLKLQRKIGLNCIARQNNKMSPCNNVIITFAF